MKTCVFVGPSSRGLVPPGLITRFAPASLGSIFQAVELGYLRIGLVDGLFGLVPSVWHKEILYALAMDRQVFGSSSMGALRAAELHQFGMKGVGKIYRYYRSRALYDDDEVSLSHGPAAADFLPLSCPMINIRLTSRRLARLKAISAAEQNALLISAKAIHFSLRMPVEMTRALSSGLGERRAREVVDLLFAYYVDQKHLDYVNLLRHMCAGGKGGAPVNLDWSKIATRKWAAQFEAARHDLPPPEQW